MMRHCWNCHGIIGDDFGPDCECQCPISLRMLAEEIIAAADWALRNDPTTAPQSYWIKNFRLIAAKAIADEEALRAAAPAPVEDPALAREKARAEEAYARGWLAGRNAASDAVAATEVIVLGQHTYEPHDDGQGTLSAAERAIRALAPPSDDLAGGVAAVRGAPSRDTSSVVPAAAETGRSPHGSPSGEALEWAADRDTATAALDAIELVAVATVRDVTPRRITVWLPTLAAAKAELVRIARAAGLLSAKRTSPHGTPTTGGGDGQG